MDQDGETLGQYLKRERESHLVPVEEIALFLGVNRASIEALEGGDLDSFPRRRECQRLVERYASYVKLDRKEVLRLFDAEWRRTGGVQRYPKLTQFADGNFPPVRSALFKGKMHLVSRFTPRQVWLSLAAIALIALSVLAIDLVDTKWEIPPADYLASSERSVKVPPVRGSVSPPAADGERRIVSAKKISAPEAPHAPNVPSGKERVSPPALAPGERPASPSRAALQEAHAPRPNAVEGKIPPPSKGVRVIGNRDSKRYHLPGMKYYDQVKAYHRIVFPSEREAILAGYRKARE